MATLIDAMRSLSRGWTAHEDAAHGCTVYAYVGCTSVRMHVMCVARTNGWPLLLLPLSLRCSTLWPATVVAATTMPTPMRVIDCGAWCDGDGNKKKKGSV